ncbi:MAG TPA: DnaJ domain-containing protein [Streptosporangiaceae bacterium]|nr:DnaJ domain-containing protein [Streptosporangiaceae bacterium]
MSLSGDTEPFSALGLPARADLTDDDVRAAWRRLAAATHPDRADGGDPGRFAEAAAAYTVLRTRSGRGEALADRADRAARGGLGRLRASAGLSGQRRAEEMSDPAGTVASPGTAAARVAAAPAARPQGLGGANLLSRILRGRAARLALRVVIAGAVSAGAAAVAGFQPATPALIVGALTWLLLTARHDLAP